MFNRDVDEEIDPRERSVFALQSRDEIPLDTMTQVLGLHSVADSEKLHVRSRRKIAKATLSLGMRGDDL